TRGLQAIVQAQADLDPERVALTSNHGTWTYADLAGRANQYSRWALNQGLQSGDVVGLLMSNQPEFVAVWLGLRKVGCVTALLNPQLGTASLAHSMDGVGVRVAIGESSILSKHVPDGIRLNCHWWEHGGSYRFVSVDTAVAALPSESLAG